MTVARELNINYYPLNSLLPYARNARTHSKRQIQQIARSIQEFGFTNPILINRDRMIVAGHGRVQAAKSLGMNQVPTICLENLSEDQIRVYILADNKLAENAGFDESILRIELQHLASLDTFDVTLTGFEVPEIDLLLKDEISDAEEPVEVDESPAVTQPGDLWQLGPHRILCGSALGPESFELLLESQKAHVVFTDPPYNVRINGHATGNGTIQHEEFAMASGEMSSAEFTAFLSQSLGLLQAHSEEGSVHFVCMSWHHSRELLTAGEQVYDSLLNLCVWVKDNGGMGSFYRSRHELVFVFRNGKASHRNNIQLGKFGRNRTNVWEYPGISTLSKQGDEGNLLALHPTVKPVALVADALLDCSARKDIVLDPFLGSGTTLLAAEQTGRICRAIELSPKYVGTAIRRWQNRTGQEAIHMGLARPLIHWLAQWRLRMAKHDETNYEIGFGKPPQHSQFQKGRSGNPAGRPKGVKNLKTIVKQVAFEQIPVKENGRVRTMPRVEAAVRQLGNKAATGDAKANSEFLRQVLLCSDEQEILAEGPTEREDGWMKSLILRMKRDSSPDALDTGAVVVTGDEQ